MLHGCANIVDVFGMGDSDRGKVMVMERLYDTLKDRAGNMPHAQKTAVFVPYLRGLFSALEFLAEHNIVHTDLHWRNIMFDRNRDAPILIDFGLAQEIKQNKFVQFPFRENPNHRWRRWHPPEQRVRVVTDPAVDSDMDRYSGVFEYKSTHCTAKYDVYSVAVEMIRFLYFPAIGSQLGFDDLMRMCILHTKNPNIKTFEQIENAKLWITNETLEEELRLVTHADVDDAMHSYFTSDASGYPQLKLFMPTALGKLLKKCLMFEDIRYTAREALDKLIEFTARGTPACMTTGVDSGSSGWATGGTPIRNAAPAPTPTLIQTVRKGDKELSSRKGAAKRKPLVVPKSAIEKKPRNLIELRF